MPVYKDTKRGTWYFITRKKLINGKTQQIKRRGFKTKSVAKEAEAKFLITQHDTRQVTTFNEVATHYLISIQSQIKASTFDKYNDDIRLHLLPYFNDYPIAKITAKNIEDWKTEHLAKGYSHRTKNNHLKRLSSIFTHGVKFFDLTKNPVTIAGGFKTNTTDGEMLFWTFDQFNVFIDIVDDEKYRLLFNTLYFTGMRRGELLALQWKDIEDNVIKISKAISRPKTGAIISSPKTPSSIREIVMPTFLAKELETYKEQMSNTYAGFGDYFFVFGDLTFLAANTLNKRFHAYMNKLPPNIHRIRMHDLRHSHASYLINVFNANPVAVSKRLGHKDVSETLNTYSHLYPNGQFELANQIDEHFSNVTKMLPRNNKQ